MITEILQYTTLEEHIFSPYRPFPKKKSGYIYIYRFESLFFIPAIRISVMTSEQVTREAETLEENLFITVLTEIIQ